VAPKVEAGLTQLILALGVFGEAEFQASVATTERTALAAVIVAALAVCAGEIKETAKTVAKMLEIRRLDLLTTSAYSSNLGIT
jgi:hypothetical protein